MLHRRRLLPIAYLASRCYRQESEGPFLDRGARYGNVPNPYLHPLARTARRAPSNQIFRVSTEWERTNTKLRWAIPSQCSIGISVFRESGVTLIAIHSLDRSSNRDRNLPPRTWLNLCLYPPKKNSASLVVLGYTIGSWHHPLYARLAALEVGNFTWF